MEVVRDTLSRVHSFVGAYKRFTNLDEDLQHKIQQRVYESILFAFTSPFMSIIRKECLEKDGKQGLADVPRILLLGGKPRSGKTTALDFISRLVGSPDGQYYQYKDISGTKVVFGMMSENNVFPLFVDEVESGFLKKSNTANYGTGMIKAVTNELEESGPVFFGTTNMDEFSASDAAMRRIYYLAVSNTFDVLPTAKAGGFLSENLGFQPVARFLVHRPKHSGVKAGASYTISRGLDSQIP